MQFDSSQQIDLAQSAIRTKKTTIFLWVTIIVNILLGLVAFYGLFAFVSLSSDMISNILSTISGIINFLMILGAALILKWKKIGFYIYAGCTLISIFLSFAWSGNIVTAILFNLLVLAFLYYLLQFPKENKAWTHLS